MNDLVEFLRARFDEDEAAAKAWLPFGNPDAAARAHIARHDPARVLRQVDAQRRIVDEHTPEQGVPYEGGDENDPSTWVPCCSNCQVGVVHEGDWPCLHLRLLALPYDTHPDYDERWRP